MPKGTKYRHYFVTNALVANWRQVENAENLSYVKRQLTLLVLQDMMGLSKKAVQAKAIFFNHPEGRNIK